MANINDLRKVIELMWKKFSELPLDDQIALAIVTIHQEAGWEIHLPNQIKNNPMVSNYYRSRWGAREVRTDETREYCKKADKLMESVWFPTFKYFKNKAIDIDNFNAISKRAGTICIAMQDLNLPTPLMIEIIIQACVPFTENLPYHYLWDLVVMVKHFHDRENENKNMVLNPD
jgi:hypothetical protein